MTRTAKVTHILIGAVLFFGTAVSQLAPASQFALLQPGEYHGSDVPLNQPTEWVGVFCGQTHCYARQIAIRTARVLDEVAEDNPKEPTGTSVRVLDSENPLFLARGVSSSSRNIDAAFVGETSMVVGDTQQYTLKGQRLVLRVDGKKTPDEPLPRGASLVFSSGTLSQELFRVPEERNDPFISVLWIGDLDGDGKPDLLLNTSWHYNISHKVLWLSSLAKPGELVGQAAVLETVGC